MEYRNVYFLTREIAGTSSTLKSRKIHGIRMEKLRDLCYSIVNNESRRFTGKHTFL
jgi:hypothetical protein